MISVLIALVAVALVAAFAMGWWMAERQDNAMWRDHGYCPTCNRLTTDQEVSQ